MRNPDCGQAQKPEGSPEEPAELLKRKPLVNRAALEALGEPDTAWSAGPAQRFCQQVPGLVEFPVQSQWGGCCWAGSSGTEAGGWRWAGLWE